MVTKKALKIGFRSTILLLIVIISVIFLIITFIDPNDYKPLIIEKIEKITNRKCYINGPIEWTITPQLALSMQDVKLKNLSSFEDNLLTIKKIHINLNVMSFILGIINIKELEFYDTKLYLLKDKQGITNIDDIYAIEKSETTISSDIINKLSSIKFNSISFKNSNVFISDIQNNFNLSITEINLYIDNFKKLSNIEDVELSAFLRSNKQQTIPDLEINTKFSTNASNSIAVDFLNIVWGTVPINFKGNIDYSNIINSNKKYPILKGIIESSINDVVTLQSNIEISNNDMLNITELKLNQSIKPEQSSKGTINGYVGINLLDYQTTFNVSLQKIHLLNLIKTLSKHPILNTQNIKISDFTIHELLNSELISPEIIKKIKNAQIEGNFFGHDITMYSTAHVDSLKLKIKANKGIINFHPIDLIIHKDQHIIMSSTLDLTKTIPQLDVSAKNDDFFIEHLMPQAFLSGSSNFNCQLSTIGNDFSNLKSNIKGKINLQISNGQLNGFNLLPTLQDIQNLLLNIYQREDILTNSLLADNENLLPVRPTKNKYTEIANGIFKKNVSTPFNELQFDAIFENSIAKESVLTIDHNDYKLISKGSINLAINNLIQEVSIKHKPIEQTTNSELVTYIKDNPIIIQLIGPINKPSINFNLRSYIHNAFIQAPIKGIMKEMNIEEND